MSRKAVKKLNLELARKQNIAKRNDMIQNSMYSLAQVENKAIHYILSKVKPEDPPGKIYEFDCEEFKYMIGWTNKQSYKEIKDILTRISQYCWWLESNCDEIDDSLIRWFHIVRMNKKSGKIKISLHDDMHPFVLGLNQQQKEGQYFTTYMFQNIGLMKNRYSQRIYELLKSYQYNNKKWVFEIGTGSQNDLFRKIAIIEPEDNFSLKIPKSWSNYAIFNRDVLKKAKEEINKYTDIKIDYVARKEDLQGNKTRKYTSVEFYMAEKTDLEKEAVEKIIDAEYKIEDVPAGTYRQLTIEEVFFKEHDERVKIDQEHKRLAKEEKKEKQNKKKKQVKKESDELEERKYPIISDLLYEYKSWQIERIAVEAQKHIVPGKINMEYRELWIADYVTYYNDKIRDTPDDTKTTPYKRLMNLLRNDYDCVAAKINEYDKDNYPIHNS